MKPMNSTKSIKPYNQFINHIDGWDLYYSAPDTDIPYIWMVSSGGVRGVDISPTVPVGDSSHMWPTESVRAFCLAYHALIS